MQPNRIGVLPDELVDVHSVDFLRPPDPFLFPMQEDGHELFSPLFARLLFCWA